MDRKVLEARLRERCESAVESAVKAVEEASDGRWIAESEWPVREIFQQLTVDCYAMILQSRVDAQPSAKQAAFSPCGKSRGGAARQGPA
jgi:hypothetical protein